MKVLFQNSQGKEKLLSYCDTMEKAWDIIEQFLNEHNYKNYYQRRWVDELNPKRTIIDVGSHTEFFIVEEEN